MSNQAWADGETFTTNTIVLNGFDCAYQDDDLPLCRHENGVERSNLEASWICADCGAWMMNDETLAQNGKGDTPRPVNKTEYDKNYEAVFGKQKKHVCNTWVSTPHGERQCYHCGATE